MGKLQLLKVRRAWWNWRYANRTHSLNLHRAEVATAVRGERTARDWHNAKALARAQGERKRAEQLVRKWVPLVAEAAREVARYDHAIAQLQPKPPPVSAKEAWLARVHPELRPGVRHVTAIIMTHFPGLYVTSTTGGQHAPGSLHYQGRACDLGTAVWSAMDPMGSWIERNLERSLTEGIHNPTLSVKYGSHVSAGYWGEPTWANHRNHIHVGV